VPPGVLALVAVAAVLHASWNVILKGSGDPLATAVRAMVGSSFVAVPVAVGGWLVAGGPTIPPVAWACGIASGALECIYFALLASAYRRGGVSVVYPVARGTAPLLTVAIGVLVLGERLSPEALVGVGLLVLGLLTILRPWRALTARRGGGRAGDGGGGGSRGPLGGLDPAVGFALATGVAVATYSAIDSIGAKATLPIVYSGIFYPIGAVLLVLWARYVDPRLAGAAGREPGAPWGRATMAGLFTFGGYLLILTAYSVAPLAVVSPLRESAIVLGAGWASFRMGEATDRRDGLRRTAGAAIVVLGAILIGLGG
jgi:drug/metabolite transporter (DMT)-like permease